MLAIFKEIDKVLPNINRERKRMISIQYIVRKLFVSLVYHTKIYELQNQRRH